jgi:petrobactin synthase
MLLTRQQIAERIYHVLRDDMGNPYVANFQTTANFREELGLDSSAILQMMVLLEVKHGLELSEDAVMAEDFETVRSVTKVLHDAQWAGREQGYLDFEDDIKLHCVVSCFGEAIKRQGLDQRALYFGVWDSEVMVDDQYVISYHSETISHDFFIEWFQRLYGVEAEAWYRRDLSKDENAAKLEALVTKREDGEHIMVMLDMHQLPERVNEFNKDPFPHYVTLGPTADPDTWFVYDPDYRYEGVALKQRLLNAMKQPSVAGGYWFREAGMRAPHPSDIAAYFETCFRADVNLMTEAIRATVEAHLEGVDKNGEPLALDRLGAALTEIPILAIRKYGYEHGLAFFFRELLLPEAEFESWCVVIEELAKTFKLVQFQSLKLAATGKPAVADKLFALLDEQDERERKIKARMNEVYELWRCKVLPRTGNTVPAEVAS